MKVDNETYFALVEEHLAAGGQVKIPLVGTSMRPTLLAGDVIVLEKAKDVAVGDVVLFRHERRHLLHRVVAIDGDRYTMQGDNCAACETARREDIVAKMVAVEKKHPLKHLAVRWLGHKGRKQLRPWYFLALALLMWAPMGGVPLDNFVLGLRTDHLLHASVFIPCSLFIYDLYKRKWAVWPTAVAVGVLTESVQALLPYRGFDINDMIANFLGVSLGWLIILIVKRKKYKK
ncbi:MAG: VanZ family protein [Bacteroidales bacterium]|nr:VanZ family protein [Bacteroidales bacterium]